MADNFIIGTEDGDILVGTDADDMIEGLGGDDVITEESGGADEIYGGDGNDLIFVRRLSGADTFIIDGGAGDDRIVAWSSVFGFNTITTGSGQDVLSLDGRFIVTDFTAGNGGDRIDFTPLLARLVGWDQASNPFAGGQRVRIIDSGGAAVIQYSSAGTATWTDFAYLNGVTAAQLTAFNLSGLTQDGAAPTNLVLTGTAAGQSLTGFAGNDTIDGLAGNDTIYGGIGNDTIHGGDNDDYIDGQLGADSLFGDGGNDTILDDFGGNGSMDGGAGNDTLTVNLNAISYTVQVPLLATYSFIRTVLGGDGDDSITFISRPDTQVTIDGGLDNDQITYRGGSSAGNYAATITGGDGNDLIDITGTPTVDAGAGEDLVIIGTGTAIVTLGSGVDTVRLNPAALPSAARITDFQAGNGGDVVDIAALFETIPLGWDYSGNPLRLEQVGADVHLKLSHSQNPTLLVFENRTIAQFTAENFGGFPPNGTEPASSSANGTPDDDVLVGTIGDDTIDGLGGNDTITGGFNDDTLYGGEGNDDLDGQGGRDRLEGGAGNDILRDTIGPPSDHVMGGSTIGEVLLGGAGNDTIIFSHSVTAYDLLIDGGDDDDVINVTRGVGTILGGAGNDQLTLDNCYNAQLIVDLGAGNDTLLLITTDLFDVGSSLTLGAGRDSVTPTTAGSRINILDFQVGEEGDRLDLSVAWGADPFGTMLTVVQQGADTLIKQLSNNGTLYILRNVNATDLSAYNLGVPTGLFFNPAARNFAGTPAPDLYISADGNDTLAGQADDDTIYGAGGNDVIDGGADDDALYGGTGNDVLIGGTGIDRLDGGDGDDELWVDNQGDILVEGPEGGNDIVYASASYELAPGAAIETLSTSNNAGTAALTLIGNDYSQTIYGNAGANYLDGGAGDDTLVGFGGDDSYVVDDVGDYVAEFAGGGNDIVYVRGSFSLGSGQEVETLAAFSQAGTDPIVIVGNGINQTLYGNAGDNYLDGLGGNDTLVGFGGNDSYVVDDVSDYVAEFAGNGDDTVYVRGSFSLGAGQEVETLAAFSQAGTAAIVIIGNAINQRLFGNNGDNYLDGGGGTDILQGFSGNDSYVVDDLSDFVVELAGQGNDVVYARASYVLGAGQSVEVLSAISNGATTAMNLTGNELANTLYANNAANTLNGGGGADFLQGFGGADNFAFTTALGGGNVDTIADFVVVDDTIQLDDAIFTQIGALGALNANAFVTGTAAADADDRIIYNSATGQLFYDADGNGAGAQVQFATLTGAPALTASDFMVI